MSFTLTETKLPRFIVKAEINVKVDKVNVEFNAVVMALVIEDIEKKTLSLSLRCRNKNVNSSIGAFEKTFDKEYTYEEIDEACEEASRCVKNLKKNLEEYSGDILFSIKIDHYAEVFLMGTMEERLKQMADSDIFNIKLIDPVGKSKEEINKEVEKFVVASRSGENLDEETRKAIEVLQKKNEDTPEGKISKLKSEKGLIEKYGKDNIEKLAKRMGYQLEDKHD